MAVGIFNSNSTSTLCTRKSKLSGGLAIHLSNCTINAIDEMAVRNTLLTCGQIPNKFSLDTAAVQRNIKLIAVHWTRTISSSFTTSCAQTISTG